MDIKSRSFAEALLSKSRPAEAQEPDNAYTPARPHTAESLMLELCFKNGDSESVSYAYLVRVGFNASGVIRLQFSTCALRIEGRNLRPLYDRLIQHKVSSVSEMDVVAMELTEGEKTPLVTRIAFEEEEE